MEEDLFTTYDRTLYKTGNAVYTGDGRALTSNSTIEQSSIGDGFSTGHTEMVQGKLQSGIYETGVSGWSIDADGNCEFNDGVFRGDVTLGNVVRTIDTAEEIQDAIDEVSGLGGGTIYLAPGTYNMTSDITIPSNVYLLGASRSSVIIDFGSADYSIESVGTVGTHIQNILIKDLTVQNSTGRGIYLQYNDYSMLDSIDVFDCGTGIEFDNVDSTGILGNGVFCDGCTTNLIISNSVNWSVYFSYFSNATGNGVEITDSSNATFFDSSSVDSTGDGFHLTNVDDVAFISVGMSDNGGNGMELVSGCDGIQLTSVTLDGNTSDGIKLTATSDNNTISSCTISNNGGYGINIAASTCDNNQIIAPAFTTNSSGNIYDDGTNTFYIGIGQTSSLTAYTVANLPIPRATVGFNNPSAYE